MRRIRLVYLNALLYAGLAILVIAFWPELRWAGRALPLYLVGGFPPAVERVKVAEALRIAESAGDIHQALELVTEAVEIDPNSFVFLHGELERRAGHPVRALELYARALELDPSLAPAYLAMAGLLAEQGRRAEGREVLRRGIAWFASQAERYRPQFDDTVAAVYNRKAQEVYEGYAESLRALRRALSASYQPVAPSVSRAPSF